MLMPFYFSFDPNISIISMKRTVLFIFMLGMFNRNNKAGDDANGTRIMNGEVKNKMQTIHAS